MNRKKILPSTVVISFAWMILSCVYSSCSKHTYVMPTGWVKAGSKSANYEMGVDNGAGQNGKSASTIKIIDPKIQGFGTMMQTFSADTFVGKRLQVTAYMKTNKVKGWAGFWVRIDGEKDKSLSFDNMHDGIVDRSLKGTNDWKMCTIVLDVPTSSSRISYGALLHNAGQIWFDDFKFEIVDSLVPTTDISKKPKPKGPTNLDFSK